jgi:hypothetical protein
MRWTFEIVARLERPSTKLTQSLISAMNTRNSRDTRFPICCRNQHTPLSSHLLAMIISEWSPYPDICLGRVPQPTPIHLLVVSVCLKFRTI